MPNVLLLRAPSTELIPDPYEKQFESLGYQATSIAVLETVHTNLEELQRTIHNGPLSQGIQGVIVTSSRASDAWREAVQELNKHNWEEIEADWSQIPFYAVGASTATALTDIKETLPPHLCPANVLGAAETGTSERLACFILSGLSERQSGMRLFYLTGDKNRDTLPKILYDGGVELEFLQVYETRRASGLATALQSVLESRVSEEGHIWWLVFFAPSSTGFALPFLRKHFRFSDEDPALIGRAKSPAYLAAIGPTTAAYLRNDLGLRVDVIAAKPGPVELAAAIAENDLSLKT